MKYTKTQIDEYFSDYIKAIDIEKKETIICI
jgi:hypothetical protein